METFTQNNWYEEHGYCLGTKQIHTVLVGKPCISENFFIFDTGERDKMGAIILKYLKIKN